MEGISGVEFWLFFGWLVLVVFGPSGIDNLSGVDVSICSFRVLWRDELERARGLASEGRETSEFGHCAAEECKNSLCTLSLAVMDT